MNETARTPDELEREIEGLRLRLEEAEETLRTISSHEVDAFLVHKGAVDQVLVLDGVDRPYRLMIERMQQGAATLTADGTIVYVNRRLSEMLNRLPATLVGTRFEEYVLPRDRPALATLLEQGVASDTELEVALQRGDNEPLFALLTSSSLLEEGGILCLIVTDLTQQKRHEQERERYLEEKVARAAAENTAVLLREADRRKDEFLAMLGHELRNPLGPLRNGLQILNLISSKELEIQKVRDMMARQVESLVRLVDDLLDVGRVTQGKIKLSKERIDLREVVERAVECCRELFNERGHHLECALPESSLLVEVDIVRIAQIVTNLLNNAAKFTPRGGRITLVVERDRSGLQAVIRVRDNGVGIAPEMLRKVFDLFTQADPSVSRSEGGLGIGLTLARKLAEMHDGSVEVSSPGLGKGSEFTVRLPLVVAPTERAPGHKGNQQGAEGQPRSRRVLIVDDNRDAAQSLALLLRLLGHETSQAHDGVQALAVVDDFKPQLVLLDIGLPGKSGYEVALDLRARPAFSDARIVALSGYGSPEDRQRSQAAGFHDHLVKPVEFNSLKTLIDTLP